VISTIRKILSACELTALGREVKCQPRYLKILLDYGINLCAKVVEEPPVKWDSQGLLGILLRKFDGGNLALDDHSFTALYQLVAFRVCSAFHTAFGLV